jgi:hypothetical protein
VRVGSWIIAGHPLEGPGTGTFHGRTSAVGRRPQPGTKRVARVEESSAADAVERTSALFERLTALQSGVPAWPKLPCRACVPARRRIAGADGRGWSRDWSVFRLPPRLRTNRGPPRFL